MKRNIRLNSSRAAPPIAPPVIAPTGTEEVDTEFL
jgi:hypothetical protein